MNGRGRPKKDNAKTGQYRIRLSQDEEAKLARISEETGVSKADILRKGLKMQYDLFVITH